MKTLSPQRQVCLGLVALAGIAVGAAALRAEDAPPAQGMLKTTGAEGQQYWLGVAVENVPRSMTRHLKGLTAGQGLMVVGVLPHTPAEKAGLKAEDLLIELNGTPLMSQEQLARAVNTSPDGKGEGKMKLAEPAPCDVVYLRDGDRHAVKLVPQLRPSNMLVTGANLSNFVLNGNAGNDRNANRLPDMQNLVLPNGLGVQVGPGYQFDLRNNEASTVVVREALKDGQPVVMSQEADANGNLKKTLSTGGKTYAIPDDIEKMPGSLQPLAREFQNSGLNSRGNNRGQNAYGGNGNNAGNNGNAGRLNQGDAQKDLQGLKEQQRELEERMKELSKQIEKIEQGK